MAPCGVAQPISFCYHVRPLDRAARHRDRAELRTHCQPARTLASWFLTAPFDAEAIGCRTRNRTGMTLRSRDFKSRCSGDGRCWWPSKSTTRLWWTAGDSWELLRALDHEWTMAPCPTCGTTRAIAGCRRTSNGCRNGITQRSNWDRVLGHSSGPCWQRNSPIFWIAKKRGRTHLRTKPSVRESFQELLDSLHGEGPSHLPVGDDANGKFEDS